jgi:hypothetical protein
MCKHLFLSYPHGDADSAWALSASESEQLAEIE